MNVLGKGSKPVTYKSNIRLQFYGTEVDDCCGNVDHIYVKLTEDGTAAVYGDYTYFLLFNYKDKSGQIFRSTDSKSINFSEFINCPLEIKVDAGPLQPKASFQPHINFRRSPANAYTWEIEIEGELEVTVCGEKNGSEDFSFKNEYNSANNTTVMPLNNLGIPINQLLEMDTASINKLVFSNKDTEQTSSNKNDVDQLVTTKN